MTLDEAVEILIARKHGGSTLWRLWGETRISCTPEHTHSLDPFEAIAVAEKYQREKPASRGFVYTEEELDRI